MKTLDEPTRVYVRDCLYDFVAEFSNTLLCPACKSKLLISTTVTNLYKICVVCRSVLDSGSSLRVLHRNVHIRVGNGLTIVSIAAELEELGYDLVSSAKGISNNYFVV